MVQYDQLKQERNEAVRHLERKEHELRQMVTNLSRQAREKDEEIAVLNTHVLNAGLDAARLRTMEAALERSKAREHQLKEEVARTQKATANALSKNKVDVARALAACERTVRTAEASSERAQLKTRSEQQQRGTATAQFQEKSRNRADIASRNAAQARPRVVSNHGK